MSTPPMQGVKALLVDLDGTLLESRGFALKMEFIHRSLRAFGKQGGGRLKALRALRAMRKELENPTGAETNDVRAAAAFAEAMELQGAEASEYLQGSISQFFPKLKRHFYPVPGALEFVEWARGRYPVVLATNPVWPIDVVRMRLEWAGVDPEWFQSITHSGRMHVCKPAVGYYREVLRQEGLKAEECLLIGDDYRKDLPARRAGVRVFILDGVRGNEPKRIPRRGPNRLAQAYAWRGNYKQLRAMLEEASK